MRIPRFRLRSLMVLVLITALILGAGIPLSKLNLRDINDLKARIFLLGSFLLLVLAKLILFFGVQFRRQRSDLADTTRRGERSIRDEPFP